MSAAAEPPLPAAARGAIVITGASSGIGAAVARELAGRGERLFVLARRGRLLDAIAPGNPNVTPIVCDVGDPAMVQTAVDRIGRAAGHIHALVHSAGVYGPIGLTTDVDAEHWKATVNANLFGLFNMVRGAVPWMRGEPAGRIIAFSGGGAFGPRPRHSAYAVSKAAIVRLIETLAHELAPNGIMVNAVAPGFVATEMVQATLSAGPEQAGAELYAEASQKLAQGAGSAAVAVACICWLLSDAAQGLTGKTISASFDPWSTSEFGREIPAIVASDLYTMQRINLIHLAPGEMRDSLLAAAARSHR